MLPQTDGIASDSQLHEKFEKHTITKSDEPSCKVCVPVFYDGFIEHFLKFLMLFKQAMPDMSLDTKSNRMRRKFRHHTRGYAFSRFDFICDQQMVDLPCVENLALEHSQIMIAHAIVEFGRTSGVKCVKCHMDAARKAHGASQMRLWSTRASHATLSAIDKSLLSYHHITALRRF